MKSVAAAAEATEAAEAAEEVAVYCRTDVIHSDERNDDKLCDDDAGSRWSDDATERRTGGPNSPLTLIEMRGCI